MMDEIENSVPKQRKGFQPGRSGNPAGKPKGARHRATVMLETLFDGEAESVARSVVAKAIGGDMTAARLILERICPPRKGRPLTITLTPIHGLADFATAQAEIIAALAEGELTPEEAGEVAKVLDAVGNAIERRDFEARISALEKAGIEK